MKNEEHVYFSQKDVTEHHVDRREIVFLIIIIIILMNVFLRNFQ